MQAFINVHVCVRVHVPLETQELLSTVCNGIMSGALPDNSHNYFKTKEIDEDSL